MARRRRQHPVEWLISTIDRQLRQFGQDRANLTLRQKVQRLVEVYEHVKDLGSNVVRESGLHATGAIERIRLYLIEYVGQPIDGAELAVVAGISEYGRRIRQLRKEEGYQIASGASPDPNAGIDLRPDQYLLASAEPDQAASRRWHIANRIRRSGQGSRQKVLAYLIENLAKVVTTEELAYVANEKKEYARRIRELRTEEGYQIATRLTGRPDLAVGQYVLQSTERIADPHDRNIPAEVERAVYARDQNACKLCGWNLHRWTQVDPRILELHHLLYHRHGGANEERNLVVLCSRCHDEVHAGRHEETLCRIEEALCRTSSR